MDKKCAIYNRYSINDQERLKNMREKMIEYCENILKIKDYKIFEEIGSVKEERKEFDKMMKLINQNEFTDLITYSIDRLYKPMYDLKKFETIIGNIDKCNVKIHTIKE